ncbi:hypothetical protein [Arcicella aurantiaca]|uniref:hypothetical protein n=1 Tax=Arcicella aurantiaca TaxID=591202 RepID=UPI001304F31A|nr:hypothetical protein [Arcicella aurantiaca]
MDARTNQSTLEPARINLIMEAILEILIAIVATDWKKVGKVFSNPNDSSVDA